MSYVAQELHMGLAQWQRTQREAAPCWSDSWVPGKAALGHLKEQRTLPPANCHDVKITPARVLGAQGKTVAKNISVAHLILWRS